MSTRLCVGSVSTHTRYARLDATDCARLFVSNSLYCPRGEYNLSVTDGNAVFSNYKFFVADDDATGYLKLGMANQRCIWVTISKG